MPFISDAASAIKSRFGFQDRSSELVQSSPAFLKSATKDILVLSSAIRSTRNSDDNDVGACSNNVSSGNSFEFHEDPSFWKDNNVQVIIRIRPLSSTEISLQGHGRCVRPEKTQTITWMGHPESRFTFDVVADENVSQESLFKVAGLPMVENCVAGYNSCMFAYGQTGSGKTYTMLGDIEGGTRRHSVNCGMTPRVFEHMFSRIQKEREAHRDEKLKFVCKCSFLEIYNEQILDLLDPSSNNLQIREDTKKGVYVENLKEIEVTSARDVMQQLIQGAANRKVAATNMNRASSRSHSVFTCIIESEWESQGLTHKRFARLNLVDLAGSERQKSSGAEGERLKEATNINKSLSTLGLVIMNLVNISNGKSVHVPYRDSKLTFLLQDSLGGNAKTIIIANISPSSCCSLETLSTLKFAQRAKFIKNNAIINEDTSGDVITMKLQIQQLKKEVSRLRGLVGGGPESQDNEMTLAVSCPGSPGTPGSLKLEGLGGAISPLASAKRVSHKRDYEVALVGAFRREKDKDITLQALTVENKAAVKLAKQREDEIQGLKMRLRFREAAIKRLEAVASGKISAEVHLLKEKEEHLKEIEVLQAQVDRNQEVTRFAMENLRLKEEIRRLKSFYEEGEREHMNEQILVLEGKLLEALDWKFMHESDPSNIQKTNTDIRVEEVHGEDNLLICNKEPVLPWQPSVNEENELLRMQAIHNQAEMDELRKKLEVCLEEKEKLERQDSGSMRKRDDERDSKATKEGKQQVEIPSHSTDLPTTYNDQTELKTMVDVIAAASQREAEAHETAIILSKENDELRMKLKVLIDDNNKLIELYERAILESNYKNTGEALKFCDDTLIHNHGCLGKLNKEEVETSKAVDNLEHQLAEMHEENEKLMGLYERAMTERDELKRMLSAGHKGYERLGGSDCIGLVEVDGSENMTKSSLSMDVQDGGINNDSGKPIPCRELNDSIEYSSFPAYNNRQDVLSVKSNNAATCNEDIMHGGASLAPVDLQSHSGDLDGTLLNMETVPSNLLVVKLSEVMNQVRKKLERADEQLSESAKALALFCMLEKKIVELDKFSSEVQSVKDGIQSKQEHYDSLKTYYSEVKEKKALTDKQLLALKYSLSNFSSSVAYFQERETRAEARLNVSTSYVSQKKEELACQLEEKNKIEAARRRIQQSESELTKHLSQLKLKLEEENHKQEDEKVLFAIDNIEKITSLQKTWQVGGKATELLKSEEEKTKLQAEIKLSRERIGVMRTEIKDLNGKILRLDSKTQAIEVEIQKGKRSVGEMELAFQAVIEEKNTLLELIENGNSEIGIMIVEYLHLVFQADLKNEEMKVLEKELLLELRRVKELGDAKATANEEMIQLLDTSCRYPSFISEKLEDEIHSVRRYILEANSLLIETVY